MAERHRTYHTGSAVVGSGPGEAPVAARLPRSRWNTLAGLTVAALVLGGCGGNVRPSYSETPEFASLASIVPNDQALILPGPGGPRVMKIVERKSNASITQTIFLANDSRSVGENQMSVTFYGPVGRDGWGQDFYTPRPTANSIYKEIKAALPGVPMHFSAYYVQNKYGPFSYAVGQPASGGLCIYGWQLIRAKPQDFFAPNLKRGAVSVRVRVCQANVTEAQLLQILYDYTITGYFPPGLWNPFGDLPPVDPTLGTLNNPTAPMGREGLGSPINGDVPMTGERQGAVGRTATTTRRVRRVAPVVTADPMLVQPLPQMTRPDVGYPIVPPPAGSGITPVPSAPATVVMPMPQVQSSAPARTTPVPVQPTTMVPRVVAPQVTPGYSTVPVTPTTTYPAAPGYTTTPSYPAAPYPTTTPSLGTHATVPVPAGTTYYTQPTTTLQNPYNQ